MRNNLSFLQKIFGQARQRAPLAPLYRAIVAEGRDPAWYHAGVTDTLDGRFDMIAAVMALALLRIEAAGEAGRTHSMLLTELFIEDMDGTLRQIGIGDHVVGKHVGKMMGALGGRLSAFRAAREAGSGFAEAVRRNIFHESPPSQEAVDAVAARLEALAAAIDGLGIEALLAGRLR
jgi:cytochrome b pre-mRNA-processing protein 3